MMPNPDQTPNPDETPRSFTREEYDAKWANYTSGTPAADPRGLHHRGYRRWPELEHLCRLAETRRVHVTLAATTALVVSEEGKERRELSKIALFAGGREVSSEYIRAGDLDVCANSLQPILLAGFSRE